MAYQNPYYTNLPSWGSQNVKGYRDSETFEAQDPSQQNQTNYGQTAQNAGAGLSAGMANSEPLSDFTVDQYAGFKGSGQGLMSGGVVGAIVGGVTAQFGQFSKVNKNLDKLQTGVEGVTFDAYGRPVYQGQNITQAQGNLDELNKGVNKLNKTHLDPATNVISSITGTRRKMKRKRAALQLGIKHAQQDFNTSDIDYRRQMNQQAEYYDRLNNNRISNLYR